jgi:Bcr/CflA subfamily drug resistance transporter
MTSRTLQTFIVLFIVFATVSATDIFLPSLPHMAVDFKSSEDAIQLSIPLYLIGSLLSAPFFGVLSDHFGRKPIMLLGMGFFLLGTLLCMYSLSLSQFLSARFIQGVGAAASSVVGWAIVQDLYQNDESAKTISWMGSLISLSPLVAPAVGGYVHIIFGWQGNFLLIFLLAAMPVILLTFTRTHPSSFNQKGQLRVAHFFKNYVVILKNKLFLSYICFFALLSCGQWCYLTIVPFYFENSLHLSPNVFGIYLSGSVLFYIFGQLLMPFFLKKLGANKTIRIGILFAFMGSFGLLCVSLFAPTFPLAIILTVGIYFFGIAVTWGPSTSRALQCFDDMRGAASAVRGLLIFVSFGLGGFMGSLLDDSSLMPLACFLLLMALGCWIVLKYLKN